MFDAFVAFQARVQPEKIAISTSQGGITFAEFDANISRFASQLLDLRVTPNETVAVAVQDPYLQWLFHLSLARLGIATAPGHDRRAEWRLTEHEEDDTGPCTKRITPEWIKNAFTCPVVELPRVWPQPDALGFVLLSSGTTGNKKRIGLSWKRVDANVRNAAFTYGALCHKRWLVLPGIHTALGFAFPLGCWAAGASAIFGTKDNPSLQSLLLLQPDLVGLTPIQLQELLSTLPEDFAPASPMRVVSAGSIISRDLIERARQRLSADVRSVYGASECGAVAVADGTLLSRYPGTAGYPMPGVEVEIVDQSGNPLARNLSGEVRVRSDRTAPGYLDDPSRSTMSFRDGWFFPGDIGRLSDNNLLFIEGRTDDLMNLGGDKVLPELVERVALDCLGVTDAAAFAVSNNSGVDRCWVALVVTGGFDVQELERKARGRLAWLGQLNLVEVGRIPRNEGGKIDRPGLKKAVMTSMGMVGPQSC